MVSGVIWTEFPEFTAIALAAGIEVDRMAEAFSDPARFFEHITLEELDRLKESFGRFTVLQAEMNSAFEITKTYVKWNLARNGVKA